MNPITHGREDGNLTALSGKPAAHDTGEASTGGASGVGSIDSTSGPRHSTGIGWIVLGSLATGLLAGVVLAAAPFIPATEEGLTGAMLLGFALGWAVLAMLSIRFSDQPQRWAVVPAVFMGLAGVIVILGPASFVHGVLAWAWPPLMFALVVWIMVKVRRSLRSRTRRWVLYPVLAVLALSAVGAGYQTTSQALDTNAYPMPGQLIDVGGHKMHLSCTGSGSPTVVLEPGAGEMSAFLGWVAPDVARETRVCVYDRAGRGWSEPAAGTQDGTRIATDLHTLLHQAGIPGPYVLAGHSFGGLYVLNYAAQYPEDVAGLVLVDSTAPAASTPGNARAASTGAGYDALGRISAAASAVARLGLARLAAPFSYDTLPAHSRDVARASVATANHIGSSVDEYLTGNASMVQARALVDFADKPLVVLTAGRGSAPDWFAKQDRLAELSTNSAHHVVPGASHASLIEDQDDAATVIKAINDVLTCVRTAAPLAG